MIAWQPDAALPKLTAQFGGDPFGALALAGITGYGTGCAYAGAWRVGNSALLGRLNGTFTLAGTAGAADCAALADFLPMIGCGVLCAPDGTSVPGGIIRRSGDVMQFDGSVGGTDGTRPADARTAAAILADSPSPWITIASPDALYVDLSHRMRHGCIRGRVACAPDGTPAACAVTLAETDRAGVLAVACRPDFRGRGYASQALRAMCGVLHIAGKVPMLMSGAEMGAFYGKNGFVVVDRWAEWEV